MDKNLVGVQLLITYGYMVLWIFLSSVVILLNKYILAVANFPYPVALTCTHMLFCSLLAFAIVKIGWAEAIPISADTYISCILPIGVLFATTLWLGNAAYLYLSVSFIQMVKASMPMIVFTFGVLFQVEKFTLRISINLIIVGVGISIASYGEINFVWHGFLLLFGSLLAEALRLNLIQILLQRRGIRLNPVSTLYHIAPCCFVFLFVPFLYVELPKMYSDPNVRMDVPLLLVSALSAFALNMSIFLLIGRTSALTMNVAGVVKDWLLIVLSVVIYGSSVTKLQLLGYGIAFAGVMYYNHVKIQEAALRSYKASKASVEDGGQSKDALHKDHLVISATESRSGSSGGGGVAKGGDVDVEVHPRKN